MISEYALAYNFDNFIILKIHEYFFSVFYNYYQGWGAGVGAGAGCFWHLGAGAASRKKPGAGAAWKKKLAGSSVLLENKIKKHKEIVLLLLFIR